MEIALLDGNQKFVVRNSFSASFQEKSKSLAQSIEVRRVKSGAERGVEKSGSNCFGPGLNLHEKRALEQALETLGVGFGLPNFRKKIGRLGFHGVDGSL